MLQVLDLRRAKGVSLENVARFYLNLELLYQEHKNLLYCIWNIDESKCQASQNGLREVFAKKGWSVHKVILAENEWCSVLLAINANDRSIPNYYIFKEIRKLRNYVALCKEEAMLQKRAAWTLFFFIEWINHFIHKMKSKKRRSQERRNLMILDGDKSHIILEVLMKTKDHRLEMISLSSHTI